MTGKGGKGAEQKEQRRAKKNGGKVRAEQYVGEMCRADLNDVELQQGWVKSRDEVLQSREKERDCNTGKL